MNAAEVIKAKCSANAAFKLSHFFENAFVDFPENAFASKYRMWELKKSSRTRIALAESVCGTLVDSRSLSIHGRTSPESSRQLSDYYRTNVLGVFLFRRKDVE
jgi:hypothetical protein